MRRTEHEDVDLLVGEQLGPGMQRPARGVERVALVAAVFEAAEGRRIGVGERIYALTDGGVEHVAVLSG